MKKNILIIYAGLLFLGGCKEKNLLSIENAERTYLNNKISFINTVKHLDKIIADNSELAMHENIYFVVSSHNIIRTGLIEDSAISKFLIDQNISGIHIYNNSKCNDTAKEFQTFSFESDNNIYIQYDKCLSLAPIVFGTQLENTRSITKRVDKYWVCIEEK